MSRLSKKSIQRCLIWFVCLTGLVCFIYFGTRPFVDNILVPKTIKYYEDTKELFEDETPPIYQGVICDTIVRASGKKKSKLDTIVHRQHIELQEKQYSHGAKPNRNDVGLLGDSTALFNTIFAFLAFIGLICTLAYQIFKDSRDKQQANKLQFEQEFFNMTAMLEDIVSHLEITDRIPKKKTSKPEEVFAASYDSSIGQVPKEVQSSDEEFESKEIKGRAVFKYIYVERPERNLYDYVSNTTDVSRNQEAQLNCFDGSLDHYFRYLYRILKHIDSSDVLNAMNHPQDEKRYYAHLLRVQLSCYELLMWYYNGLLGENYNTVKGYIERYQMFDNLRTSLLGKNETEYNEALKNYDILDDSHQPTHGLWYSVSAYHEESQISAKRREQAAIERKNQLLRIIEIIKRSLAQFNIKDKLSKPFDKASKAHKPKEAKLPETQPDNICGNSKKSKKSQRQENKREKQQNGQKEKQKTLNDLFKRQKNGKNKI